MPKAPAERTTAAAKARRPHAPKSRAVKLVQLHDALRRQLLHEPADALKSCQRVLRRPSEAQRGRALNRTVAPDDALARATRLQLLITLERYRDALSVLATGELPVPQPAGSQPSSEPLPPGDPLNHPLETSYCLYKLDRFAEARSAIEGARDSAMDPDALDRGLLLLEAQILYRLEDYSASRDAYEALLVSVELDSPEHADIETNIAACSAHLDFLASIPTRLADAAVDVAELESTPLVTVLPQPVRRQVGPSAAASTEPPKLSKKAARRSKRPPKLPPSIAALPEDQRPAPDPFRWVKKTERPNWPEQRARLEKEKAAKRGRNRAQERARDAAATQGGQAGAGSAGGSAKRKGGKKR